MSNLLQAQPNIIFIISDDAEYIDHSFAGGFTDTPRIDWLQENGSLFTNTYNQARCSPTRAAFMTGLYPQAVGLAELANTSTQHHNQLGHINLNVQTLAEWFQQNGYATYMSGKWHMGYNGISQPFESPQGVTAFKPLDRGFDSYAGIWSGESPFDGSGTAAANRYRVDDVSITIPPNFYATDWFGDRAVDYINNATQPYFLYVPFTAPHNPLLAPPDGVLKQKYIDRLNEYDDFEDVCKEANLEMLRKGITTCECGTEYEVTKKGANRNININNTATRAAMMESMDQNIGKIIDAVIAKGELENTIIIYCSDNGGQGTASFSYTYNCPYRGLKLSMREGGQKTPLIFYWKDKAKVQVTDQFTHMFDLFPTFVDIVDDYQTVTTPINNFVGKSIKNVALTGLEEDRCILTHFNNITTIHQNHFKFYSNNLQGTNLELYKIDVDNYEKYEISQYYPDTLNVLNQKRLDFLNTYDVISTDSINTLKACYPNCPFP